MLSIVMLGVVAPNILAISLFSLNYSFTLGKHLEGKLVSPKGS
jgi:hypothetical protein